MLSSVIEKPVVNPPLDTSYSKVPNESKKINFISVDNINHNLKKSNQICYEIYENELLPDLDQKNDNILHEMVPGWDGLMTCDRKKFLFENLVVFKDLLKNKNDLLLYYVEKSFLGWYNNISNISRYIYLKKNDNKYLKKIICRFHPAYAKKIQNRMNWLMYQFGNENALMLTLTLNPSNFGGDKKLMWEAINLLLNEFFDNLRIYYKNRALPFPKYIRSIEAMKGQKENDFVGRGNPHIHVCLFGVKWLPKQFLNDYWPYGFSFIDTTAKGQKVRYPIHYITKYITKTYNVNDPDNTLNQSLVWFFNKNCYDHSKGLVYPLQKVGDGSWAIYYIVEMDPLENQFLEMDYIFEVEESFYKIPPPKMLVGG